MISTSTEYKAALATDTIASKITGKLVSKYKKEYEFTEDEIIPGTLSVTNKCVNGSGFEFGCVYAAELNISLKMDIDRYSLYGGHIELSYDLLLPSGEYEKIPLGIYSISEPIRTKRILAIKAYDNMLLLDVPVTDQTAGNVYDLLSIASEKSGVELAQMREEILLLPNASSSFSIYPDRVDTFRDVVAYLAMLTGTFATIDRAGKLKLVQFQKTTSLIISDRSLISSKISDYKTYHSGICARFIAEENFYPYLYQEEGDGLFLDMGDIPIVQGLPEFKYEILETIFAELKQIVYAPCEAEIVNDPSIELGDMLEIEGENCLITSFTWSFHSKHVLKSAGANPKLAGVKDRTRKMLANMEASISSRDLIVYTYTNGKEYKIKNQYIEVAIIRYVVTSDCKPIFLTTICFELDKDGIVEFSLLDGLVQIANATYKKWCPAGVNYATISCYLTKKAGGGGQSVRVNAKVSYMESWKRKQDAEVATINNKITALFHNKTDYETVTVDTTSPTLTIKQENIRAMLYAQGLGTKEVPWDGVIEVSDNFTSFTFDEEVFDVAGFDESVNVETQEPKSGSNITQSFTPFTFDDEIFEIAGFAANAQVSNVVKDQTVVIHELKNDYLTLYEGLRLQKEYHFESIESEIDNGRMSIVEVSADDMERIIGIETAENSSDSIKEDVVDLDRLKNKYLKNNKGLQYEEYFDFVSAEKQVDAGRMSELIIQTNDIKEVLEIEVNDEL